MATFKVGDIHRYDRKGVNYGTYRALFRYYSKQGRIGR